MRWTAPHKLPIELLGISLAYAVAVVYLVGVNRLLGYDEAVYYSQFAHDTAPLDVAPGRSLGIAWLIAPATLLGAGVPGVRAYLILIHAAGLYGAFAVWHRTLERTANLAAALFGGCWLALFYAPAGMPNLLFALLTIAATGIAARTESLRHPLALAGLFLAMGALRPVETAIVGLGLGLARLATKRSPFQLWPAAVGGIAGVAPWLISSAIRVGGFQALFFGGGAVRELGWKIEAHLGATDGPLHLGGGIASDPDGIPLAGVVWWLGLVGLTIWGLVGTAKRHRTGLVMAAIAPIPLLIFFFQWSPVAPRYLLPVYGLLGLPAAHAVLRMLTDHRGYWKRSGVVVLVLVWFGWNVSTLARVESEAETHRRSNHSIGVWLKEQTRDAPCAFGSDGSWPLIAVASGCRGTRLAPDGRHFKWLERRASEGRTVFLLATDPSFSPDPAIWESVPLPTEPSAQAWRAYRRVD